MSQRRPYSVWFVAWIGAAALLCATGCTLGPREIRAGRLRYNESIQKTFQEEMLLNLVRLKYREAPEFLAVGGIAAQYSFDSRAALGADVKELAPDILGIDGSIARSERPTITYAPQRSETFSRGLLSPISIESLAFVARTGWRADRILRLTVQDMNLIENARSAGGPTPDRKPEFETFLVLAGHFRDLQERRLVNLAQSERPTREDAIHRRARIILLVSAPALLFIGYPTFMVALGGMLPTLVAFIVDSRKERYAARTVGYLNGAGVFIVCLDMWSGDHTWQAALEILYDPLNWLIMFGTAALGWGLFFAIPPISRAYLAVSNDLKLKALLSEQERLAGEWGDGVKRNAPADGGEAAAEAGKEAEDGGEPGTSEPTASPQPAAQKGGVPSMADIGQRTAP